MPFLLGVVGSIVALVLNVNLARNKRRGVVGWVVAALLFGLLSSLVLWVLPSKEPLKRCPRCLGMIPAAATRCAHCQADLPASGG